MKFYLAEAEKLAQKYKTRDPERIAKELGITILYLPFKSLYGISVSLDEYKLIGVNADLDEQQKKLVIAHETGHFTLHPQGSFMYILDHTFFYSKEEYQANMFALGMQLGEEVVKYKPLIKELAAGKVDKLVKLVNKEKREE